MNNINKIKNDKSAEIINPQSSIVSITEVNNLLNKEDNKEKENESLNSLSKIFLNFNKNFDNNSIKNNNKTLSLSKILEERQLDFEIEFYENFNIYQAQGFFKEGKHSKNINDYTPCRLIIKESYLYVLKNNNRNNIFDVNINPEISFLDKLENLNIVDKNDTKYIKYDYELSRPLLCLNFDLLTCILLINKKYTNEFTILILGTNKRYSFIIEDPTIKEKFCYTLGNFISDSDGYIDNELNLIFSHPKNFNLKTYITPEYFESIAKTGDIILFKTNHKLTKAQRLYTCDNYDHIALVFFNWGFLSLFDASKKNKCQYHYWGSFKSTFNHVFFHKVVYRRLNIEEKDYNKKMEIQERIEKETEEFLEKIKDKRYYLSICDILFKRRPRNYELKNEWEKAEGFSCSSLIAAYYIKLGIIKIKNTVHSVLPGDFEENKNICFQPGFSLGPEKIIEFST